MPWDLTQQIGPYVRPGELTGRGWLWEIQRGAEVRQVLIEVTGTALETDIGELPDDTRAAIESQGESAVLKVLDDDDPPTFVECGSGGCYRDGSHERL